ncbi:MAG: redox-sensing transcriptional repressor Rex [Bacteroidales bacterium]|nr:redox-sensing transcriptional repressor Rex [Bacteroidales bacterium]
MKLPEPTVERLSEYRRSLLQCLEQGKTHIFSHELATLHHNTAVQVRRDIMFIGYSTNQRKGYDVRELIDVIGSILDSGKSLNIAVVGMGNLGSAITAYFLGKRSKMDIVASFDVDPQKVNREFSGILCHPMSALKDIIREMNISIAIMTVPADSAVEVANLLDEAGIKGILNFTSIPVKVSPRVYLEDYDMITFLEKVAYFVKHSTRQNVSPSKI